MSAIGTKQTSVCVASMSALEVKRTKVHGDLNFYHRLGSTIFPFRRFPASALSLSGWPELAGTNFFILGLSFLMPSDS